jgi:rhamnulokinase
MKRCLIFDLGAGSGRAIVGALDNNRVSFEEIHRFDNRPVSAGGELFWDVLRLFSEIKAGIEISAKKYEDVGSLAIDTWGCDFGIIDRHGRLIGNPVNYRDVKRHERAEHLHELLSEKELFMLSGGPQDKIMGLYQLFSLQYEKAVEYQNAFKLLMIPDILNYFLTGEVVNEFTNATMTLMCNHDTRQWEKKIIQRFGFPESIFSNLTEPGACLGMISKTVCTELGVKAMPVILPPTHDTAAAVAGIPLTESGREWGFGILGTWCVSGIETQRPVINEKVLEAGFGNEGGVEGKNMLLKNITGMWIIQQCREKWGKDAQRVISWDEITAAVNQSGPVDSYIDVDDPSFGNVQPDMPGAIVKCCSKTGQKGLTVMGEIARCFFESLALKFRQNFDTLQALTNQQLKLVHLIGGGVQNRLLCQWIADVLGIPVVAGPTETTSVGNLIFQLKAAGVIGGVKEGRQLCRNSFEIKTYQPENPELWQEKYHKYLNLLKK